ncbi:phosphonate C-P lyase system protein PhnG [Planococcus shenhongbingii]|uniref:Phosphonate C-P lyase system protein PhnG n=1 Tax=Planococcus shenhongbingii TaxID=3058398 RepID=A0ABT8NBP9_9BACL|nr:MULTISPECIES: phosphonate C-P lyase system protein PhnG [unclassified Planococcus (in: firmicutes)]MDN7245312.1 phosphonate C-P lyase system protein PhnG [Planococcus sp. N017]WKA58417.1 phosphonate C-P lyase system protein PhnG [Planococcus sp. N016]
MKRRRRTEILIQGNEQLARGFAETIAKKYECREISAPQYGMTMIKMRESAKNSLFYIGEVLVTEAKVEIGGQIGIGIVAGMKEELARNLAIIDAAYKADLPETAEWQHPLLEMEKDIAQAKSREQAELFETKVSFETMEV